ncbi:MAG: MXAN_6230/SCO0854 family RING domain-containing protein [Kofleriaceae bacterium]
MDPIRTLLLARTHTVVLDPDRVASAATRPARNSDVDRFEDELVQLGYVMSLDLAMTIRRFPHEAIQELRHWMLETLARPLGAHRPHVPLFRGFPAATPRDTHALYVRRVITWLLTRPEQPCPWCGQTKTVHALDPCGHLVCRQCWDGGNYAGCPVCHRRVSPNDPFFVVPAEPPAEPIARHDGQLRIVHLAFDVVGAARERFERLIARATPLSPDDRDELETVIDAMGPKVAIWLPARIPVKETMAIAVGRLWVVSPDRGAMVRATQGHVRTATDVLRVAAVLMKADPALVEPMRLASIGRGLRRAVLEALDRLPIEQVVEDMRRRAGLWKRVGERLHPFEHAARLPSAALAFAAIRGTDLGAASFGAAIRERAAAVASVQIEDDRLRVTPWGGPLEDALRRGDPRSALARLDPRPGELLRRLDHLVRVASGHPEELSEVLAAARRAVPHGAPATLLTIAAHVARRGEPVPRRVFLPRGEVLRAWTAADDRAPLPADAIGAVIAAIRGELVARAEARPRFARAVIDRGLADLPVPINARTASRARIAWPRGSAIELPGDGAPLRMFLHWEEPPARRVDLDLSVALYDHAWRHVGTCDFTNLVFGECAAVHSGDLTSAPAPLGASEFVDLHVDALHAAGARHAVVVVFSYNAVPFDQLRFGFAGVMIRPEGSAPFDPRAVAQRFDLHGRAMVTVPLAIDLEARRLRWLDVHVRDHGELHSIGGYRRLLAHSTKDLGDYFASGARPSLWDLACIHAAARANVIYVRGADAIHSYRRRDGESSATRLGRLLAGEHDGEVAAISAADAPTWVALLRDDLDLPRGSSGYVLDARRTGGEALARLDAADLVAQLQPTVPAR